jgi:hypothetical protein
MGETLRVYTRQAAIMYEELQRDGRYVCLEEYVRSKNDTITDYYVSLYRWLAEGCKRRGMVVPQGAEFPIWLALTEEQKLGRVEGTVSLTLDIPREEVFILDYDKWGYRVNYFYVPKDPADEAAHQRDLERRGIANETAITMGHAGNFHPDVKAKITRSWERVFQPNEDMRKNVGICWEILPEWVVDAQFGAEDE